MGGGAAAFQQAGGAEDEGAHADGSHVAGALALGADEGDRFRVGDGAGDAAAARDAEKVEGRAVGEGGGREDFQAAVARDGGEGLRDDVGPGVGEAAGDVGGRRGAEAAQDLVGAGEVELGEVGEEKEGGLEGHA